MYEVWNKENYNKFIEYLYSLQDLKYKEFSSSLMPTNDEYELIGIRFPILKEIAKKISKNNYIEFININNHKIFEEIMIHGLIIGYLNEDIDIIIKLSKEYIKYIQNWSLCDSFVANLHIMSKYSSKGLNLVKWCLNHKKTYYKRVGYVLLLNYFVKDEYLDLIFSLCDTNNSDEYYVKMAISWLIAECYTFNPTKTINYIKNNKLDKWTHNKAIQKIRESRRVNEIEKQELLKLKR